MVTALEEFQPPVGSKSAAVNFHDDDMMGLNIVEGRGRGSGTSDGGPGGSSNRWPRDETLALIRIRTEMDAMFQNAALKAPIWEELSRRLAELGYQRSGKKCKEKFKNVDKYYKRAKEGRTGRQDGKSYHLFSELEALHATSSSLQQHQEMTVHAPRPLAMAWIEPRLGGLGGTIGGDVSMSNLNFSSMSSDEDSDEEYDEEDKEEEVGDGQEGLGGFRGGDDDREGSKKRMLALFEGMMRQIIEKQDAMQKMFLETLNKWEKERIKREEAWRRKEVALMKRERELLSQERSAMASRDAALIAFLNRIGGEHSVKLSPSSSAAMCTTAVAPPPPHQDAVVVVEPQLVPMLPLKLKAEESLVGGESSGLSQPLRWPKEEVQALIDMRIEKEEEYNDMLPKGLLWEDIAAGMKRIGYNRSAKRCKEKWENINKYFKKVRESNKRRPEDSKTCPYFHQLNTIYHKKHFIDRGSVITAFGTSLPIATIPEQESPSQREKEGKCSNDGNMQLVVTSKPATIDKKGEITSAELNIIAEDTDSEDMEGNDTNDDDDDDDEKMQYKIEFQKPISSGSGSATCSDNN
ncbi:hypothetical protein GUJ93_ZPchr0006g45802 [Zizania palustris]|uniref:Myb-like domain-containing protein n=1 Tax=Zizania palustris TaxID=103762 RepID=A0A8J5VLM4_ZIZPA|nr:hypothetical protein GUJ93_ZPchr0006g45802 [Zizania palustris]